MQYLVHHLLTNYGKDAQVTQMLDTVEFLVVPVLNMDGYEYSWNVNRLWRKNRRENGRFGGFGVDLNRNWNAHWDDENGASRSPLSETYKGPSVASEPEVQAITKLILQNPRIIAGIDFHAYSQLILRPYGHTYDASPHEKQHKELGDVCVESWFIDGIMK